MIGEILKVHLLERRPVTMNGVCQQMATLEAIMLQLMRHAGNGNARARRLLLQFQRMFTPPQSAATEVEFVDSPYTDQLREMIRKTDHG